MGRRVAQPSDGAVPEKRGGSGSSAVRQAYPSTPPAPEALLAFAEELGRMVARQLSADPNRRRGYALPQLLIGLTFNAAMMVIAYWLLAWLRR